jgi:hypothetical protein
MWLWPCRTEYRRGGGDHTGFVSHETLKEDFKKPALIFRFLHRAQDRTRLAHPDVSLSIKPAANVTDTNP